MKTSPTFFYFSSRIILWLYYMLKLQPLLSYFWLQIYHITRNFESQNTTLLHIFSICTKNSTIFIKFHKKPDIPKLGICLKSNFFILSTL